MLGMRRLVGSFRRRFNALQADPVADSFKYMRQAGIDTYSMKLVLPTLY